MKRISGMKHFVQVFAFLKNQNLSIIKRSAASNAKKIKKQVYVSKIFESLNWEKITRSENFGFVNGALQFCSQLREPVFDSASYTTRISKHLVKKILRWSFQNQPQIKFNLPIQKFRLSKSHCKISTHSTVIQK